MIRTQANMSQAELARKLGMNVVSVNKYERGERNNPTAETVARFAEALNTTPDYLLGMSDNANEGTVFQLTDRERAVINLWRRGMTTEAIRLMLDS
jgi:transcriptional regulator with XRE-family HTH domain